MPIDAAVLASAKRKASAIVIGQQALNLWASTQRDILATAVDAEVKINGGVHPAVVADGIRRQGTALVTLISKASAKVSEIKEALALPAFGEFTEAEVDQPMALILGLAVAMRDTLADGSGLSSLISTIKTAITPTGAIW